MGPKGAVEILFKDEIARADDSQAATGGDREYTESSPNRTPPKPGGIRRCHRSPGHPSPTDRGAGDVSGVNGPNRPRSTGIFRCDSSRSQESESGVRFWSSTLPALAGT